MRLIDADELRKRAETSRETTEAFQELIDKMPSINDGKPLCLKPIQHFNGHSGHPAMSEGCWYTCPICGSHVRIHIDKTCKGCGSIMLWNFEEHNESVASMCADFDLRHVSR